MQSDNPLIQLKRHGQSVWLDQLARPMIHDGTLDRLIHEDGLSGITSNPKIFNVAMTRGDAYDDAIAKLTEARLHPSEIYEELAVRDIQDAADRLRPVYDDAKGTDGFVSLEVSPHLARKTDETVDEAIRLWSRVDRPNLLIKIPGTEEGMPAVRTCLARGINVNITLLFSLGAYERVMEASLEAMESRLETGEPLDGVFSVASFFLSRIDVKVDDLLEALVVRGVAAPAARLLRGRTAIASAKLAAELRAKTFHGERWNRLEQAGARPQKVLWASTSTKNPDYSDVKYVEALIGEGTINTMPMKTLAAFRDHGRVASTLERDVDEAREARQSLAHVGIDMNRVTDELLDEGIRKFLTPFDELVRSIEEKQHALVD